jgi:hypothetical protein
VPQLGPGLHDVTVGGVTVEDAFDASPDPNPAYFERVLFPVAFGGPGANGSVWRTVNTMTNRGPAAVATDPIVWPFGDPLPSGESASFENSTSPGPFFVRVPREQIADVSFSSHIRDISLGRGDGTEIRVVRERDTAPVKRITGVAIDRNHRYTLRIYDLDAQPREVVVTVRSRTAEVAVKFFELDGSGFLPLDLRSFVGDAEIDRAEVSVRSTNDARLWALLTATNNETQHVTTYTPQ